MNFVLKNVSNVVNSITEIITVILLMTLVVVVGWEVVARFVFDSPLGWSAEYSTIAFTWLVFLGASIGLKRGAHLGLRFATEKLPSSFIPWTKAVVVIIGGLYAGIMVIEGTIASIQVTGELTTAMQISASWQYAAVPVGAFCMLVHVPYLLAESLK